MTRLRVHYDGWVVLPADLRRKLALDQGGELEVELGEGQVALRPLSATVSKPEAPPAAPEARPMRAQAQKPASAEVAPPARRPTSSVAARLLPALKARGRRRKTQ